MSQIASEADSSVLAKVAVAVNAAVLGADSVRIGISRIAGVTEEIVWATPTAAWVVG